jgi:hypothetical protein
MPSHEKGATSYLRAAKKLQDNLHENAIKMATTRGVGERSPIALSVN